MKVSELSGAQLDEWVARAEGHEIGWQIHRDDVSKPVKAILSGRKSSVIPQYSTDWACGGPIIERHRIAVTPGPFLGDKWGATVFDGPVDFKVGETALIAAMRAYVISKFGDEVPDEVPA